METLISMRVPQGFQLALDALGPAADLNSVLTLAGVAHHSFPCLLLILLFLLLQKRLAVLALLVDLRQTIVLTRRWRLLPLFCGRVRAAAPPRLHSAPGFHAFPLLLAII